ncbi:MAG TPA: hypothetical protein VK698_15070 [Kofleriaceae bacterium]|nr:hypothetical protein [Kofleriaceae bacterium]
MPLGELSPEEFESFVFVALDALSHALGFRLEHKTGAGGDDGFDAWGRRADGTKVCIQSKRWQHLSLDAVALELAKVALTSRLDGATVSEHYVVASGTLAKNLAQTLRADDREALVERGIRQSERELPQLRDRLAAAGHDPAPEIREYITRLEVLAVWSGNEFDTRLGTVWSALRDPIERTFAVQAVLHEKARPDFDEDAYLRRAVPPSHYVDQVARRAPTPANVRTSSAANPSAEQTVDGGGQTDATAVEVVLGGASGDCVLLTADGGGGKTTTLKAALAEAARARSADPSVPLPILLPLKDYREDLDTLVGKELGITNGHWRSLPGRSLLLLDGLSELPPTQAQYVANDVEALRRDGRAAFVITMREAGAGAPVVLERITACWTISRLDLPRIRQLASRVLAPGSLGLFMAAVLQRFGTVAGRRLISLPFVARAAAETFAVGGTLASTLSETIGDTLTRRYRRNQEVDVARAAADIAELTLRQLGAEVSYQLRIVKQRASLSADEMRAVVHDARTRLTARGVFGAAELTDNAALDALVRHEYVAMSRAGRFSFTHDLVAGFLAAHALAGVWRDHLESIGEAVADDVWLFTGRYVAPADQHGLIRELVVRDVQLAAQVAVEAGIEDAFTAEWLLREPKADEGELAQWRWMAAAAIGATPASTERVRQVLANAPLDSRRFQQAQRVLAMTGDPEILSHVLGRADRMRHRGLKMSGGELATWSVVPPVAAMAAAKKRIDASDDYEPLGESALTLGRFGDESQISVLEVLIDRTRQIDTLLYAGDALYRLDPDRARRAVERAAGRADGGARLQIEGWLVYGQGAADAAWLIDFALADVEEIANRIADDADQESTRHSQIDVWQYEAGDLLGRLNLRPEHAARLISAFAAGDDRTRHRVWRIAAHQPAVDLDAFAQGIADEATTNPGLDVGYACNYAARRAWPPEQHREFTRGILDYIRRPDVHFTWDLARALEYLLGRGERAVAIAVVEEHVRAWFAAHEQAGTDGEAPLQVGTCDIAQTHGRGNRTCLDLVLSRLHNALLAVASELDPELRVRFISMDTFNGAWRPVVAALLEGIPAQRLDAALAAIQNPFTRTQAVTWLAPHGRSELRVKVLCDALAGWETHPLAWELLEAVGPLWCEDVAARLVEAVVVGKWEGPLGAHNRQRLFDVNLPFDRVTVDTLLKPALARARTADSRTVLEVWIQRVRYRREEDT